MAPGAPPYLITLVGRSHEVLGQRDKAAIFLDLAAGPRDNGLRAIPADTTLDVALTRGPRTGRDAVAVVRGLIGSVQTGAAIANAEAFLRRNPGSGDAFALAGDAYLSAGQGSKAADYFAQAAAIRQSWPLTRRMVAAEMAVGRTQSGLTLLQFQLANNPANTEAAIMLAEAELTTGNARAAGLLLDLAIANGAARDPNAQMLRARAALELGDMAAARKAAMRAYSLQRMNADATTLLAEILSESGEETAQSQALFRKAAKLPPR